MVFRKGFKRNYKRRYGRKIRTRKVAIGSSKTNIVRLQKQISTIRRGLRKKAITVQYQYGVDIPNMTQDFAQVNLTQYASWTPCFGASVVDGTDNRAYYKSATVDCRLSIENLVNPSELDTLDYTFFLVSLRDEASNIWNQTTGVLTMVNGRDYSTQGVAGMMVRLNPKMFKIHRMKRLTSSNFGTSLGFSTASNFKPIVKWTWRYAPKRPINNPIGDWSALAIDRDPSKNYYILAFNNNSSVDGTFPQFTVGTIHTVQVQGA